VRKAFPDHSFLGEESVDPGAAASAVALNKALKEQDGFMWVVSG
jgi:myo-inositol-1(or 4)-monophosphatase